MATSGIYNSYNMLINGVTSSIERTAANNIDNSGSSNSVDTLELNSTQSDLPAYLNYNSTGNYSSLSLADFLNNDSDDSGNSLFGLDTDSTSDLLDSADSTDSLSQLENESISGVFETLANTKTEEINELISKTLNKYAGTESEPSEADPGENK